MKTVLLVCGAGASSGFVAGNIRKAVAARKVDYEIIARSDAEIENYIQDICLLLVGPHLAYMLEDLKNLGREYHVPVKVIPKESYGLMDGEVILDFIIKNCSQGETA